MKFRQAMSYALDRNTINETLYYGKGTVRQATASADVSFMKEELKMHLLNMMWIKPMHCWMNVDMNGIRRIR